MLPLGQDFIQLAIRTNLMFFYFEGILCSIWYVKWLKSLSIWDILVDQFIVNLGWCNNINWGVLFLVSCLVIIQVMEPEFIVRTVDKLKCPDWPRNDKFSSLALSWGYAACQNTVSHRYIPKTLLLSCCAILLFKKINTPFNLLSSLNQWGNSGSVMVGLILLSSPQLDLY